MTLDERAASLTPEEIVSLLLTEEELRSENAELQRRVAWFERQLFGRKSEQRIVDSEGRQLSLGEIAAERLVPTALREVGAYRRRPARAPGEREEDGGLRFDPAVPIERIELPPPPGVSPETHERVSEKTTDRLAQRSVSYVVLRYVRGVWKAKEDGKLVQAPAPGAVLERSAADVSVLAGIAIDKYLYHLPLYRQHQRMAAAGVHFARATLTNWMHRTAELLDPIYEAQLASIRTGSLVAVDETPIRAGRDRPGRMRRGYFWPIYGERDEVAFLYAPTRGKAALENALEGFSGTLLSDGYEVYDRYVKGRSTLVHALCWSHARRKFERALEAKPSLAGEALQRIGVLYEKEAILRKMALPPEKRLAYRAEEERPLVDGFFAWLRETVTEQLLLPKDPFLGAAHYALERETGLRVFLENPDLPIDTNHLEREIRPIAVGRKNWLFCWTEIGAHHAGVLQSLIRTCRLHGIDPYAYLVDVLQRIDGHPARDVEHLTPRSWKKLFADQPLRSDIDRPRKREPG